MGYWTRLFDSLSNEQRRQYFYQLFNVMIRRGLTIKGIAKQFDISTKYVKKILGRGQHE